MRKIHPILASYIPAVEGIGRTLGDCCEVVLHDLTQPDSSVVAIYNGHITGRSVGSPISSLGLKLLKQSDLGEDLLLNYRNTSINDKIIKSSSILIRDEDKNPLGFLCLNIDITHIVMAQDMWKSISYIGGDDTSENIKSEEHDDENFYVTVSDLMEQIIQESTKKIGKPPSLMNKEEKIQFVKLLDEKGLFFIKGAIQDIAKMLGVSKYTVYNYLEKAQE